MFKSVRTHTTLKQSADLEMTPLIDMVFILLIFFIVTTHFVSDTGLTLERPASTMAQPMPTQTLRVAVTAAGDIYAAGRQVSLTGLRAWFGRQGLMKSQRTLVIVADKATSADRIVQVMDQARGAGIKQVALATRAAGDGS